MLFPKITHRHGFSALLCFSLLCPTPQDAAEGKLDYNRDIRPILSENCFACHGPDEESRGADLRLDTFEGATADNDGVKAIVPNDPEKSELVYRIETDDEDDLMPPRKSHKKLTTEQKAKLVQWIKEGGEYSDHWAFVPATKQELPTSKHSGWARNAIDHFVAARLEQEGLQPEAEAERSALIRRVTYDLTGLPPTPSEVASFVNDKSPDAYEKVVDRLLASPRFGERLTLAWMDAARYGDSSVMHADGPRDMWPWRDWVIRAYNENMPFDQFTIEQLAGDLLPDSTDSQKVATGFNRNHATSDEGGAIAEELRVEYVVDRVKTTSNVWLGLSFECGQCHDHKYDPISMEDYYGFYAYFNNTTDPGMQTRNGNQAPVVNAPNPMRDAQLAELKKRREDTHSKIASLHQQVAGDVAKWVAEKRKAIEAGGEIPPAAAGLVHHFSLDEKGGDAIKEILSGETGKLTGKHQSIVRDKDTGADFNGGTYVDFKNVGSFPEFNEGFTLSAWVKAPKGAGGAVFSRMDPASAHRGYDLWLQGGAIGTHIINTWPSNAVKVVATNPLKPDTWQHVAATYDGSGKETGVKLYVDGVLVPHKAEANNLTATIKTPVPFRIGGRLNQNTKCSADDIRLFNRALTPEEIASLKDSGNALNSLLATPIEKLNEGQKSALTNAYLADVKDERYTKLTNERSAIDTEISNVEKSFPVATSMIMQDNPPNKKRVTYILERGHYESPIKDKPVEPGVPAALPPLPSDAPPNRLGLAQWIVSEDHPLTARVAVNRYWALLFGRGLVETVMDFGSQGQMPTHPELLDWLAVDFVESGWDIKRAIRQMVTSATYRQSSRISPELKKRDPQNLLLARGPRFRLQGEFIRDGVLSVSGLLNEQVGGPSVKPYQPDGIWNEVSLNGGLRYKQDNGDKLYRRSMYTYWKRSAPSPNMTIFDAPTREKCVVMRDRTNTPLQALVTLNDVQFVEASRMLAERLIKEGGQDFQSRVKLAFQLAIAREPSADEIAICKRVFDKQLASFNAEPESATKYLAAGEAPRDEGINSTELATWAVLANMILNLDEFLTRG